MKQLQLILVFIFVSALGCNNGMLDSHRTDECQSYYKFINDQMIKKEGYYQLKVEPQYLEPTAEGYAARLKYFNEACVLNLPRKKIHAIFGKPNKIETNPKNEQHLYTYCYDKKCSSSFVMAFKDEKVSASYSTPLGTQSDILYDH